MDLSIDFGSQITINHPICDTCGTELECPSPSCVPGETETIKTEVKQYPRHSFFIESKNFKGFLVDESMTALKDIHETALFEFKNYCVEADVGGCSAPGSLEPDSVDGNAYVSLKLQQVEDGREDTGSSDTQPLGVIFTTNDVEDVTSGSCNLVIEPVFEVLETDGAEPPTSAMKEYTSMEQFEKVSVGGTETMETEVGKYPRHSSFIESKNFKEGFLIHEVMTTLKDIHETALFEFKNNCVEADVGSCSAPGSLEPDSVDCNANVSGELQQVEDGLGETGSSDTQPVGMAFTMNDDKDKDVTSSSSNLVIDPVFEGMEADASAVGPSTSGTNTSLEYLNKVSAGEAETNKTKTEQWPRHSSFIEPKNFKDGLLVGEVMTKLKEIHETGLVFEFKNNCVEAAVSSCSAPGSLEPDSVDENANVSLELQQVEDGLEKTSVSDTQPVVMAFMKNIVENEEVSGSSSNVGRDPVAEALQGDGGVSAAEPFTSVTIEYTLMEYIKKKSVGLTLDQRRKLVPKIYKLMTKEIIIKEVEKHRFVMDVKERRTGQIFKTFVGYGVSPEEALEVVGKQMSDYFGLP